MATSTAPARPPGPAGRLGVGNQRAYERDRIGFLQRCQREYGDVFSFSDASVVVLDPELIHRLHLRTNAEFAAEASMFSERKRAEWLLTTISDTMVSRRRNWRGVKASSVSRFSDRLVGVVDGVLDGVSGREVDVNAVMRSVAGHAFADFCFGGDDRDRAGLVSCVDRAVAATQVLMNRSYRLPSWLPTPAQSRFRSTARELRLAVDARVDARVSGGYRGEARDLLDTVVSGDVDDVDQVKVSLNLMSRASYAIPGAALTWALRQCAVQPELVGRLRSEAAGLADAGVMPRPFAEAVVKETLRMFPPSWFGGREVVEPARLGPWEFVPGQQVMFSPFIVHRDRRFWDEPDRFDPDRWLGEAAPHARHAYVPFGAGPRICIGNQLGMWELVVGLSRIVSRFDIELTNVDSAPMVATTVLTPRGLRARFTPVVAGPALAWLGHVSTARGKP